MPKKLKVNGSMMTTRPSSTNTQKGFFQEIPGVTGKFGLGVKNKAGPRLTLLPRKHTGQSTHLHPTTEEKTLDMDINRGSIPKSV